MPDKRQKIFYTALGISCIASLYLLLGSWISGRHAFFLYMNTDLGPAADQLFRYWTLLGDGIVWVPVVILIFIYRVRYIPLIIAAILISTLITQGTKNLLFPDEPRPTFGLIDMSLIHTVQGVELHTVNSFPSGHTGTAFTIFLLACMLVKRWWMVPVGFFYAAMVGYSRIYLAQHFPVDVGAGILTGAITVLISAEIQKRWAPLPQ